MRSSSHRIKVVSTDGCAAYPEGYQPTESSIQVVEQNKTSEDGLEKTNTNDVNNTDYAQQWRDYYEQLAKNFRYDESKKIWIPLTDFSNHNSNINENFSQGYRGENQSVNYNENITFISDKPKEHSGNTQEAEELIDEARKHIKKKRLERKMHRKVMKKIKESGEIKLFIGNIGAEVGDEELLEAFTPFGALTATAVHSSRLRGEKSVGGYGFIVFADNEDGREGASRALRQDGKLYVGTRPVTIQKSKSKDHDNKRHRAK